eukprot:118480-Prymnesium_polylepis.3
MDRAKSPDTTNVSRVARGCISILTLAPIAESNSMFLESSPTGSGQVIRRLTPSVHETVRGTAPCITWYPSCALTPLHIIMLGYASARSDVALHGTTELCRDASVGSTVRLYGSTPTRART